MGQHKVKIKALQILLLGDPILRNVCSPVPTSGVESPGMQFFIDQMLKTCDLNNGLGLAAPQVGRDLRMFVAKIPTPTSPYLVAINPLITALEDTKFPALEGCLSIPHLRGEVWRPSRVRMECLDRYGSPVVYSLDGLAARVVLHEADHLAGVVFLDRMANMASLRYE